MIIRFMLAIAGKIKRVVLFFLVMLMLLAPVNGAFAAARDNKPDPARIERVGVSDYIAVREDLKDLVKKIGWDNFLEYLKDKNPDFRLFQVSTSWYDSPEFILKAKGAYGDIIIDWVEEMPAQNNEDIPGVYSSAPRRIPTRHYRTIQKYGEQMQKQIVKKQKETAKNAKAASKDLNRKITQLHKLEPEYFKLYSKLINELKYMNNLERVEYLKFVRDMNESDVLARPFEGEYVNYNHEISDRLTQINDPADREILENYLEKPFHIDVKLTWREKAATIVGTWILYSDSSTAGLHQEVEFLETIQASEFDMLKNWINLFGDSLKKANKAINPLLPGAPPIAPGL